MILSTEIKQNIKCFFVTEIRKSRVDYWQGQIYYLFYPVQNKNITNSTHNKISGNNNNFK